MGSLAEIHRRASVWSNNSKKLYANCVYMYFSGELISNSQSDPWHTNKYYFKNYNY